MKPDHRLDAGTIITHRYESGESRNYTIQRVLGKPGGFGITYEATFPIENEVSGNMGSFSSTAEVKVAIKEFFMNGFERAADGTVNRGSVDQKMFADFKDQFKKEAEILSLIHDHRYIVKVIDFFEANNTAYMVMEYLTGSDLTQGAEPAQPIDEYKAVTYIMQVAYDLLDVHAADIVHRDIKPSNIMINEARHPTTKRRQQIATLIDFGAAKNYAEANEASQYNIHTEAFAAPEQVNPYGEKGTYTDIYGLCATLYYMIEGQGPPVAATRRPDDEPLAMTHASPAVAQIINKGMRFEREDRYQNCMDLLQAFLAEDRWSGLYNDEVFYEKPTRAAQIRPDTDYVIRANADGTIEHEPEQAPENKRKNTLIIIGAVVVALLAVVVVAFLSGGGEKNEPISGELDPKEVTDGPNADGPSKRDSTDANPSTTEPENSDSPEITPDTEKAPVFFMMTQAISGDEKDATLSISVRPDYPVPEEITMDVRAIDGSAREQQDFQLLTRQLTFAKDKDEAQTIQIKPIDDTVVEADETFQIAISQVGTTEVQVNLPQATTVTLRSDDVAPKQTSFEEVLEASIFGDSRTQALQRLNRLIDDRATIDAMDKSPDYLVLDGVRKGIFISHLRGLQNVKQYTIDEIRKEGGKVVRLKVSFYYQ